MAAGLKQKTGVRDAVKTSITGPREQSGPVAPTGLERCWWFSPSAQA